MSFGCHTHNWFSCGQPCPLCAETYTTTATSTIGPTNIFSGITEEQLNQILHPEESTAKKLGGLFKEIETLRKQLDAAMDSIKEGCYRHRLYSDISPVCRACAQLARIEQIRAWKDE